MKKDLFLYACCIALLTACEQTGDAPQERGEAVPLQVQELTLTSEAESRVATGPVTTDGAAIGVFQLAFNGYMPVYNRIYTYSATDGGWSTAAPLFVDMRQAKIVGVYDPGNVGAFPPTNTTTVSSTKLTAQPYDETKLWYMDDSHTEVNSFAASVAFTMRPAYTRIKLSIERDPVGYVGNCDITNVTLKSGTAFYADNALDVSTGTPQGDAATGGWTYPLNTGNMDPGTTNTAYDVLVPPQPLPSGLTVTLTVDATDRSITIPAAKFGGSLGAGQEYTIQLLITVGGTVTFAAVNKTDIAATPTTPNTNVNFEIK